MSQSIRASDGQLWTLPEFIVSPEDAAERDKLLVQRYFLVRQGLLGELFRCGDPKKGTGCGVKHTYLTLACVERPFSGIAEGLIGFLQLAGSPLALARMTPEQRAMVAHIRRIFGPDPEDFASLHPRMAREIGVADRDIFRGAVPLGMLDEIPRALAQRYQDRINLRLPAAAWLRLPGLAP